MLLLLVSGMLYGSVHTRVVYMRVVHLPTYRGYREAYTGVYYLPTIPRRRDGPLRLFVSQPPGEQRKEGRVASLRIRRRREN